MALNMPQKEPVKPEKINFEKMRSHSEGNFSSPIKSLKAVKDQFGGKLNTHEEHLLAHEMSKVGGNLTGEKMAKTLQELKETGKIRPDRAKFIAKSANLPHI
jgi:hypothetical protein